MSSDRNRGGIRVTAYGDVFIKALEKAAADAAAIGKKAAEQSKSNMTIVSLTLNLGNNTERRYSLMPIHKTPIVYGQRFSTSGNKFISSVELEKWGYQRVSNPNAIHVVFQRIPVQVIVLVDGKQTYNRSDKAYLCDGRTYTLEPQILMEAIAPYAKQDNFGSYAQDFTGARPVWLRDLKDFVNSEAVFSVDYVMHFNTVGIAKIIVNKDARLPFADFINALGFRESTNNYQSVNPSGFMGRYQFGTDALVDIGFMDRRGNWTSMANELGIYSNQDFLHNPMVQDKAMNLYLNKNWVYITNLGLLKHLDTTMNGVIITKSGLVAAAHLVGIGGLQKALNRGDLASEADNNGTTALMYMTSFGGYNIDAIK